jgi:hypothetical protein
MFWADFIKFVRSAVFKNELENGNFKVKKAVEDENGENLSLFISDAKSYINSIIDASNSIGKIKAQGSTISFPTPEERGYPATININTGTGYETTITATLLEYSGYSSKPSVIILQGKIQVFGYTDSPRTECTAEIEYERKINYME